MLRFLEFKDVKTAAIKAVNFEEDEAAVEGGKTYCSGGFLIDLFQLIWYFGFTSINIFHPQRRQSFLLSILLSIYLSVLPQPVSVASVLL